MNRALDIVTTCTLRDLPTFRFVAERIHATLPVKTVHIFVPSNAVEEFEQAVGEKVVVHDENRTVPGMTYGDLAKYDHPVFPRMTGWFFQQFLKFSHAFEEMEDDYYLIWDADTVPLRPIDFFDDQGRMLVVPAEEHHTPYFDTYRSLLGEEPNRAFSFISQHLIIQKSVLREMLAKITERAGMSESEWAWAVIRGLAGKGYNLFSEYETYGHYLKNHYPGRMAVRQLPWLREGTEHFGFPPSKAVLEQLAQDYAYVSFESKKTRWKKLKQWVFKRVIAMRGGRPL
jgi:hypothetical protein